VSSERLSIRDKILIVAAVVVGMLVIVLFEWIGDPMLQSP
jgi:hypothetical protein